MHAREVVALEIGLFPISAATESWFKLSIVEDEADANQQILQVGWNTDVV